MIKGIKNEHELIIKASRDSWKLFENELSEEANNELVKVKWKVEYDELGHDIIIDALVKVTNPEDSLLQVWLMDRHPGIWIPEFRPWVSSVVEFRTNQQIKESHVGLFDSKWQREDLGETYQAFLWGYLQCENSIRSFFYEKEFQYG